MGFRVVVTLSHDWVKIAELAGADSFLNIWHPGTSELEVESVDQAMLDTAFTDYVADQTNIDATTLAAKDVVSKDDEKDVYDVKRVLRAMVELMIDEFNTLRQQFNTTTAESVDLTDTAFSDRTIAQARSAIFNSIDNL